MFGFCTADFWSSLAYESAEQKPKHCLTPGYLIPLKIIDLPSSFAFQESAEDAPKFVAFCKLVARLTQSILVKTMRFEKTRDVEVHTLSEALKNQARQFQ